MKKTAADRYVDAVVAQNVELRVMAQTAFPSVQERFAGLLNDVAQCNMDIVMQFIETEVAASDLPAEFWARVVDAQVLSLDEMMTMPVEERGEVWEFAAAIKIAACRRQALIERGDIQRAMLLGANYGVIKSATADKISVAELSGKMDISARVKEALAETEDES